MVKITTEHGEFEGETLREAEKLARKAERVARGIEKVKEGYRKLARLRAQGVAYWMLSKKVSGVGMPGGWTWYPSYSKHVTVNVVTTPRQSWESNKSYTLCIETEDGRAEWGGYGLQYNGCVLNGSGWAMAIVLKEYGTDADGCVYAVGVEQGEVVLEELEAVNARDFMRSREWGDPVVQEQDLQHLRD